MKEISKLTKRTMLVSAACFVAVGLITLAPVSAETVIEDWAKVKPPAPPELKSVTIDPKDTALLLLDFNGAQDPAKGPCNKDRPRCIASVPVVRKLLAEARAKGVLVVYSVSGTATAEDVATDVAPHATDPVVRSGPDKFIGTDLDKILARNAIKTVIITGTGAEGAVLDTATDAILMRGMNAIVPVDGMSSAEPYAEQYVAWHLTHAPGVAQKVTLTRSDLMKF